MTNSTEFEEKPIGYWMTAEQRQWLKDQIDREWDRMDQKEPIHIFKDSDYDKIPRDFRSKNME